MTDRARDRTVPSEVRGVNGDGPTCGCGGRSALHVTNGKNGGDYFLCRTCAIAAVEAYLRACGQHDQGPPPGDYYAGLLIREHKHHGWRGPVRWCPKCEESAGA